MLCVCVFVHRSRFVQDKIDAGHPDDIALCYQELRPHIALLMMDSFGHFAVGTIRSLERIVPLSTPSDAVAPLQRN